MSERQKPHGSAADVAKAERLAAALRANLKRRKAQARAQLQPPAEPNVATPAAIPPESGKNSA